MVLVHGGGMTGNPKDDSDLSPEGEVGAKSERVKMIVINEGGHFMYREHPEQFNADLVQFIDFWKGHR